MTKTERPYCAAVSRRQYEDTTWGGSHVGCQRRAVEIVDGYPVCRLHAEPDRRYGWNSLTTADQKLLAAWQASAEVDPQRLADHQSQAEAEKARTFPLAQGDGPWVTDDQGLHWHLGEFTKPERISFDPGHPVAEPEKERDERLMDHFRKQADALSPNARVRLAEIFHDAVSELEDDLTVALLACEGMGGEERHPHTFEALQDLSRALKRLSHEAGLSVAEVQAEAEESEHG